MVRLTDRLDMTIAVDWDVKPHTKQTLNKLGSSLLTKTINWPISLIQGSYSQV